MLPTTHGGPAAVEWELVVEMRDNSPAVANLHRLLTIKRILSAWTTFEDWVGVALGQPVKPQCLSVLLQCSIREAQTLGKAWAPVVF